ncbi:tetratricopeptide repeat protein [Hyalangium versicolor]|uniref:tetratricopeptide repeat protein n=1 Tax=Hyalangium versicolor TaxID=2861190 RepID=UPI001CCBC1A2|nr:hypothetical protein [Hyalangium versicolor]
MEAKLQPRAQAGLLRSALALIALVGCSASREAVQPTPTLAEAAPAPACADASSCRNSLRKLREVPLTSQCELQERATLAKTACDLGVAEGCTVLGRMALAGLGGQNVPEPGTARSLFQRACEQGDGEGCARHALSTLLGDGILQDVATGQAELQEACDKHPRSACGIAALGLAENAHRSGSALDGEWIALFAQRGCDAGDGLACQLLGDAFRAGTGVSQDTGKAFALYARACEAGNGTACANQGMLSLQSSEGETGKAPGADALFSRGCALGSSEACRLLVLENQETQGDVKDAASQEALFRQACDRGAAMGCLALYDTIKRRQPDRGASLEMPGLLKRACRLGEARACEFLEEVSRVAWRQCGAGAAPACGVIGALLLSAPSTGSEASEGLRILEHACQDGDATSCRLARGAPRPNALSCRPN